MPTQVTRSGSRITFDPGSAIDWLAAQAIGIIQRRTARGVAIDGTPFAPYSARYAKQLAAMGEGTNVDLTLTGGLLADMKVLERTVEPGRASCVIGPGTGTSPQVTAPTKGKPRAKRTGHRSPPHNVVARYLQNGTPRMKARPFVGLSKAERDSLTVDLMRRMTKRLGRLESDGG